MYDVKTMATKKPGKGVEYSPEEEAELAAYRTADGVLCVKESHILGCLERSAATVRLARSRASAAQTIKATIMIDPQEIPLTWEGKKLKDFEVDIQRAVVPPRRGSGVLRARPLIRNWEAEFHMKYNPDFGLPPNDVIEILKRGGQYFGILDWRPRYGIFTVSESTVSEE